MKTITLKEWEKEAIKRFGEDMMNWKFQCPSCKRIQSIEDFRQFKEQGATPNDAYFNCITRFNGEKSKCMWSLGGLLQIHKTEVIDEKGIKHPVFEFADIIKEGVNHDTPKLA